MKRGIAAFFAEQAPIIAARVKKRYEENTGSSTSKSSNAATMVASPRSFIKRDPTAPKQRRDAYDDSKIHEVHIDILSKADDESLDWDGLITIVEPSLAKIYASGAKESLGEVGGTFGQINERAVAYARERAAEMVGRKYDEDGNLVDNPDAEMVITDATRDAISREVTRALEEGLTPDELSDAINELIDDEARAELIADAELSMAQSSGSFAAWKESGVVTGKIALLSNDHPDIDDECDENEAAGVIPIDEPFPSGDDTTPFHVRCLCDVAAVVEGEEEAA